MKYNKTNNHNRKKISKTNREGLYAYISTVERDVGTLS
jgi:hypothetical protein